MYCLVYFHNIKVNYETKQDFWGRCGTNLNFHFKINTKSNLIHYYQKSF